MTREIDPETFNPWKSDRGQTPEAKLKLVREAARELVALVETLRRSSKEEGLMWRATNYLDRLREEA